MLTIDNINDKIAEIERIQLEATKLQELAENLKNELKAELDERKVDKLDTGSHNIFYSCYEQSRVDATKLKAAGLYEEYSKKSLVTSFKITQKKVV